MATSGTATFNPDFAEIVEEAYERAGLELRTGYDLRTARRSMNFMAQEWQNRGINLWTVETGSQVLTPGDYTYTMPADTIDLIEHQLRIYDGNTSQQADYSLARISVSDYAMLNNKLTQGRLCICGQSRITSRPTPWCTGTSVASKMWVPAVPIPWTCQPGSCHV
jgi:hypothetical protein